MRLLGLVIALLSCSLVLAYAQAQPQPPVFKAETYVVVVEVSYWKRTWYGGSKPRLDLKQTDITIVVENKLYIPSKLEPDVKRPGYYFLSFTPPEELRDGKRHEIETRIKKASFKSTETFPKPSGVFEVASATRRQYGGVNRSYQSAAHTDRFR